MKVLSNIVYAVANLIPVKLRFAAWVVLSFAAFYLVFGGAESAFADKHNLGTIYYAVGIPMAIFSVLIAVVAASESAPEKDK